MNPGRIFLAEKMNAHGFSTHTCPGNGKQDNLITVYHVKAYLQSTELVDQNAVSSFTQLTAKVDCWNN